MIRVDLPIYIHQGLRQIQEYKDNVSILKIWDTGDKEHFGLHVEWKEQHNKLIAEAKKLAEIEKNLSMDRWKKLDDMKYEK
jgi:hypothetical protein